MDIVAVGVIGAFINCGRQHPAARPRSPSGTSRSRRHRTPREPKPTRRTDPRRPHRHLGRLHRDEVDPPHARSPHHWQRTARRCGHTRGPRQIHAQAHQAATRLRALGQDGPIVERGMHPHAANDRVNGEGQATPATLVELYGQIESYLNAVVEEYQHGRQHRRGRRQPQRGCPDQEGPPREAVRLHLHDGQLQDKRRGPARSDRQLPRSGAARAGRATPNRVLTKTTTPPSGRRPTPRSRRRDHTPRLPAPRHPRRCQREGPPNRRTLRRDPSAPRPWRPRSTPARPDAPAFCCTVHLSGRRSALDWSPTGGPRAGVGDVRTLWAWRSRRPTTCCRFRTWTERCRSTEMPSDWSSTSSRPSGRSFDGTTRPSCCTAACPVKHA